LYPSTDVFVICFSVFDRTSLEDARRKWYDEIRPFVGHETPIILVGNQIDLRQTDNEHHQVNSNSVSNNVVLYFGEKFANFDEPYNVNARGGSAL